MRTKDEAITEIFESIERIEREIVSLKELVQQAISEGTVDTEIFVDAAFIDETGDEVLVDAQVLEDSKPIAKSTKQEIILEARRRAREWAESESKKKKKKFAKS